MSGNCTAQATQGIVIQHTKGACRWDKTATRRVWRIAPAGLVPGTWNKRGSARALTPRHRGDL